MSNYSSCYTDPLTAHRNKTVTITVGQVIDAASKGTVKEALRTLCPDAFPASLKTDEDNGTLNLMVDGRRYSAIQNRTDSEFADKGFYLDDSFEWRVTKDSVGCNVLVPTRKTNRF